jgi:hypothetical protein
LLLIYRNDRGALGGGVVVLVEKSLTSVEQTQFIHGIDIHLYLHAIKKLIYHFSRGQVVQDILQLNTPLGK